LQRGTFLVSGACAVGAGIVFSGRAAAGERDAVLGNALLRASFRIDGGVPLMTAFRDLREGVALPLPRELFVLTFADGSARKASEFAIVRGLTLRSDAGVQIVTCALADERSGARVEWRAILRDGAHYLRQQISLEATRGPLPVRDVRLVDFPDVPDCYAIGTCDGSPLATRTAFYALEHPFAQAYSEFDRAIASYPNKIDVMPGVPLVLSSVAGVARSGQLRRDFLAYIERERAHPYRTFLHYNSWYDIGYFTKYDQADCLSRIHAFGEELHAKRGVALASFLFDDGWDDPDDLWAFNGGFPDGFAPLKTAAQAYGARPGAWLSPWGGYGDPRARRLASAKKLGYEIDDDGLALSGPKYYDRFHAVVIDFIRQGGVNQFKIDGTGNAAAVVSGSRFGSDFEAAIALIADMRAAEPDIYVNLTTGTYPSPFWLRYCDSIWRGGDDHDFAGEGSYRQRWITYRDADTYAGVVVAGPLYPLNSLMLHGMIYAQHAKHLSDDPGNDFRSEIRSYFGTGTQLQEMYVTPQLLSASNWDDLAASARWSARNAGVLVDTHWVGGNPGRLEAYGWASWSPQRGILVLRNPRARSQEIGIDVGEAFELPPEAPRAYSARSPYEPSAPVAVRAGRTMRVALEPFEVRVLECTPVR
jgi:hypothetical protein